MRVVLVGNEKGGVGKTTVAVNLASLAAGEGLDVLLVDADPHQQSSAKWAARRHESSPDRPLVPCVTLTGRHVHTELDTLRKRYGMLVVDTGAEDSHELRGAILVANVLVIPFQPEPLDLWSLPTIETIYRKAATMNEKLRVVLALNRVPHQSAGRAYADIRDAIPTIAPALAEAAMVPLIGRAAYGRAIVDGLGVAEVGRRDLQATSEMTKLYQEIMRP